MRAQRTVGLALMGCSALLALGFAVLFVYAIFWDEQPLDFGSALMGILVFSGGALLLLGLPGLYLFERGKSHLEAQQRQDLRERLYGIILAHGQVSLDTIAEESGLLEEQVEDILYEMLGEGVFGGYIDWTTKTFYIADAALVGSTTCPNCGGERKFVGKGTVRCPYCGVTIFIPSASAGKRREPSAE